MDFPYLRFKIQNLFRSFALIFLIIVQIQISFGKLQHQI